MWLFSFTDQWGWNEFCEKDIIEKTVLKLREAGLPFIGTMRFCKIQNVVVATCSNILQQSEIFPYKAVNSLLSILMLNVYLLLYIAEVCIHTA